MSLRLTDQQREQGQAEFKRALGRSLTRRDFLRGLGAAAAVLPVSAAAYYGYTKLHGAPVKAALIGAGDEGGVLVGEHNPDYLEFVAYSDIRPSNQKRIFEGEERGPRKGFNRIYGTSAPQKIKFFEDYRKLLELPYEECQAVVIALPLHLHARVAIDALKAGKHVLCEKLMAWNVTQCKEMIRAADQYDRVLSIGHQRHYSLLYAHALEVLQSGELGEIRHIRALWHRNQTWPRLDKDGKPMTEGNLPILRDSWRPAIPKEDEAALRNRDLRPFGYKSLEELVRWRLYHRTGGGLMAELGSHQLDACSIFLGKVHPLAVSGIGGKYFYDDDREVEDHVFCTFEFPGPNYWADEAHTRVKDKNDKVIVTYSSLCTNGFEPYGECVMGNRGTLMVVSEQTAYFFPEPDPNAPAGGRETTATVSRAGGGQPAVDSYSSQPAALEARGQAALGSGPVSRGYREEMEHFAYCVKLWDDKDVPKAERPLPRCHGRVALADAIVALTANLAMRGRSGQGPERIEFQREWFDASSPAVPDADMKEETL
jgi:predicted dehydrogenase